MSCEFARVGEETGVAVTLVPGIERLAHTVGIKNQGIACAQRQFRALEFETRFEAKGYPQVFDSPAWGLPGTEKQRTAMTGILAAAMASDAASTATS